LGEAEVLLYVGRLAGEKNLDFLLRAFARVVAQRPQARLLLVGRGPDEGRLRRLARDLKLGEQVLFVGAVPHDEIPHYAALADVFVFPSLTDTQGLVLIEALAAGTPVVAIDAPGSRDVLAPGGGVLVPAREQDFAAAVLGVLGDPQRRHSLGREARQIAGRYSLPAATSGLLDVYAQALEHAALKNQVRGSKERATEPQAEPRPAAWAGMAWAGLSRKRIWSRAGKR
jgi:glycosyltransferase involved in cell wall biosynthesis